MSVNQSKNLNNIYIYLYLDIIIYSLIACILSSSFLYLLVKITGIFHVFHYLYNLNSQHWLEYMYLVMVLLIISCTGYIFTNMLEEMEQTIRQIKDDRRHLLQENMDLLKENKEIKLIFNKIVNSLEKDDKEYLRK
jgi:hypothetical protein